MVFQICFNFVILASSSVKYFSIFFFGILFFFFLSAACPPKFRWFKPAKSKGKVHELNPKAQTRGENLFEFFPVDIPVGFKMFGQPALSHIPLANVAEYFLLIIIYCVTLLLFVRAFNTHSIHSIELVTIFIFLTVCALSTLHTVIRYYPCKCISLYHKNSSKSFSQKSW